MKAPAIDRSNGYELIAAEFSAIRRQSVIGSENVKEWAGRLENGADVLELGCGNGIPISKVLIEAGLNIYGIDASPSLVAEFKENFPSANVACEAVETSDFFGKSFDAVLSWGLFFLLSEPAQHDLIARVSVILRPGGRFLFTAPSQKTTWKDVLTGHESVSLGADEYKAILEKADLKLDSMFEDEGGNHYYDAVKHLK